ncbi:polyadenylate-binding protein 6 isoform X2 [Sesamum indicum]|uniref:Polyadenylate-binding protein 6 isoform X2 n=1 Tax=Sesamum indicum TaxID=4182 RepID=A0A8M8UV44_SESIN|nr:polyadenylate-binding protein 6 isoform X2 [Sesamum indicum]
MDPLSRTSLYVGDLHPDVTEEDLRKTFGQVGPLASVRLCRDKLFPKSVCHAFVNFWFPAHAFSALRLLNHTILRGKSMRIMWYQKDPVTRMNGIGNLYVKNLDKSISSARLQGIFSKHGTVLSCKVAEENGISKGFGFVQFDSEDTAMAALKALHDTVLEGKKLYVSKFLRKIWRQAGEPGFRSLYVKNLDECITEDVLKDKFSEHGKVISAVIMKNEKGKSKGFGFVNFDSHESAKKAMEALHGELIGSKNLFVGKALEKAERKEHFRQQYGYGTDHHKKSNDSTLYVRNLDGSIDDRKLEEIFSHFGTVVSAKVIRNSDGVSKEFGFVRFSCQVEANKALNSLIRTPFQGRTLYLAWAQNKEQQTNSLQQFYSHWQSYANFTPQPLCTCNHWPRHCDSPLFSSPIPTKQMIPWHPTLYSNFVGSFSPPNPFQAQNLQSIPPRHTPVWNSKDCIGRNLPMQLASLDWCRQDRYEGISKGQKPWSSAE